MLTLFRWLSRWPLWLLHAFGGWLGWLSYLLSPSYRRRFQANAQLAGVAPLAARAAVAEAGRMVAEMPYLWMRPASASLASQLGWDGREVLDAAYERGCGVVILTPHMGCFEVTAQAIAEHYGATHGPITVLFRPARKPWLRPLVDTSRTRPGLTPVPATLAGVRQMIRALRRGEMVGLLPDQVPPEGMGVWAPFFGRPAYTMTLAARLVQQTGAALVLVWGERLPRGRGYVVRFSAFGDMGPVEAGGQAESAAAINRAMERLILQRPQQYLWGYDRYKTPREAATGAAAETSQEV